MKRIKSGSRKIVLVGASASQNDKALPKFEELALPLFDSLYNLARWLSHSQTDAEDLVQETYLKALRGFASFQTGTNFRAWMFRILRNTFFTSRSGLRAAMAVTLNLDEYEQQLPVENETPEKILLDSCNTQLARSALNDLPELHREIILLCDVEEMSYKEIAEVLSIPLGTAMSRLWRARHTFRNRLRQRLEGDEVTAPSGGIKDAGIKCSAGQTNIVMQVAVTFDRESEPRRARTGTLRNFANSRNTAESWPIRCVENTSLKNRQPKVTTRDVSRRASERYFVKPPAQNESSTHLSNSASCSELW